MILHFDDLRDREIFRTWATLQKYIDTRGFPPGRLVGRHRTWTEREVLEWIEAQPTAKAPLRGKAKALSEANA